MLSFLLLLIALLLASFFFTLGVLTTLIRSLIRWKRVSFFAYLSESANSLALSIDLMGNVVCRDLLELTLTTSSPGRYRFGNYLETISKVIGKNKAAGTLTQLGIWLAKLLNFIQLGHVERAAGLPIPTPSMRSVLLRSYISEYWRWAAAIWLVGSLVFLLTRWL